MSESKFKKVNSPTRVGQGSALTQQLLHESIDFLIIHDLTALVMKGGESFLPKQMAVQKVKTAN